MLAVACNGQTGCRQFCSGFYRIAMESAVTAQFFAQSGRIGYIRTRFGCENINISDRENGPLRSAGAKPVMQ